MYWQIFVLAVAALIAVYSVARIVEQNKQRRHSKASPAPDDYTDVGYHHHDSGHHDGGSHDSGGGGHH